jgi:thiamine pyrophosphate-dependent acetolactate synthase large subunit-like protein
MKTVRDAALDTMRQFGLTTIFGNPGSTEIPFLTDLPGDIRFVLGLHEGSVVGIATGYALARGEPAFVNLHTAAGLGNAINAIVNARDVQAPLVVVVGQQDRRQLAYEPFLAGRQLERLGGDYPVWANLPARAQDVPGAIARAYNEALAGHGPALVVVPMGDWLEPADDAAATSPDRVVRANTVSPADVSDLAAMFADAHSPALVVGAGSDSREGWDAVTALAQRLRCPVWQESFVRRAGFPQNHPQFAGILPWRRRQMRDTLAPHDLVVAVGAAAFRLYILDEPGALVNPGTRVAVITDNDAEALRSRCELALVAPVADACKALTAVVPERDGELPPPMRRPEPPAPPEPGAPLRAGHVFAALAERMPDNAVIVEETPSSQPELYQRVPIRFPRGYYAAANGGLGFGLAGSIGLRMGGPDRPVIGIVGDGSSMYAIQSLWSAAKYEVGVLLIVMSNGRYAVMDKLARDAGGPAAWPAFDVDITGIAGNLRCPARRIERFDELIAAFDEVLPGLAERREPLVLEIVVGE